MKPENPPKKPWYKSILFSDILISIAAIQNIGAHWLTQTILAIQSNILQNAEQAIALNTYSEANIWFSYLIGIQKTGIITALVGPMVILAHYIWVRKYCRDYRTEMLMNVALIYVLATFADFAHDLAILIGYLIKTGAL